METSEFDKFADEYLSLHRANISASGEGPAYFAEYKVRDFRALVSQTARPQSTVGLLDFGAGTGYALPFFPAYFPGAHVTCVDVSHGSLAIAASRFPNVAAYLVFDGKTLPFADDHFDGAYANCVFYHIPVDTAGSAVGGVAASACAGRPSDGLRAQSVEPYYGPCGEHVRL